MYESFFRLKAKPFNILPDPDYLYMSKGHENAYTHLEYAVMENKGFVVITGEIGSGKTTLINYLIGKIQRKVQIGLINQTYVTPTQFIKMVCQDFELQVDGMDKAEMVDVLHGYLLKQFANGERVILIIDEAQNLTPKTMEELRMLSNLEAEKHHLIQMILVGQPELKSKIQRKDLEQFAQRVTVTCHLNGLSQGEVKSYINYRLKVSGASNLNIFNKESFQSIYKYSKGIPRLINVICDAALVYGYAEGKKAITQTIVDSVIEERNESGLFTDSRKSDKENSMAPQAEANGTVILPTQYKDIERRIYLIENRLDSLDQRLTINSKQREDRDVIVIELFKILKDSFEKRANTLMKIHLSKKGD